MHINKTKVLIDREVRYDSNCLYDTQIFHQQKQKNTYHKMFQRGMITLIALNLKIYIVLYINVCLDELTESKLLKNHTLPVDKSSSRPFRAFKVLLLCK